MLLKKDFKLELIKFIASLLIVLLHVMCPSENLIYESIYLLGSLGIPLFFIVNGFLRFEKNINIKFAIKIFFRYLKFIVIWTIIVGTLESLMLKKNDYLEIFFGAFSGNNLLFHFWFLIGLNVVYFCIAFFNKALEKLELQIEDIIDNKYFVSSIVISMIFSFILNVVLKYEYNIEIRDVIPPALRIITNNGYFLIGMMMKKRSKSVGTKKAIVMITLCIISLICVSNITCIYWASSYYTFLPVIIASISIVSCINNIKCTNISKYTYSLISTSNGIWIMHPFILRIFNKISSYLFGDSIKERICIWIVTVCSCIWITMVIRKVKYLKCLIKP